MLRVIYASGQLYQQIPIHENDIYIKDILQKINIPKHHLYDDISNFDSMKIYVKSIPILNKNINDLIDINTDIIIGFIYEFYYFTPYTGKIEKIEKIENNINDITDYNELVEHIQNDPLQLIFIDPQNENYYELCESAVNCSGCIIQCIPKEFQTEEICWLAIKQDPKAVKYIEQTIAISKYIVKKNGRLLKFVKEQTGKICKLAVQQNAKALQYVKP